MTAKKLHMTLTGESVEMIERLSAITGLTPPNIVALLLRKSGKELELWVNSPVTSPIPTATNSPIPAPTLSTHQVEAVSLPTHSGDDWTPIEL